MNTATENIPKDRNGKLSKDFLRVVLDALAPSAGLPPIGAVDQVPYIIIHPSNPIALSITCSI